MVLLTDYAAKEERAEWVEVGQLSKGGEALLGIGVIMSATKSTH